MLLKQYYLGCLAHASYMVGDPDAGVVAVVDPQRDVERYLDDARELGVRIAFVFLTHFHADFVAGHLELRDRAGAEVCLGARADAEYDFRSFGDGDTLDVGRVRLQVLETPGHSPESISIAVCDLGGNGDVPQAVLTGDTLFVGDVGRPDLRANLGWDASELARMLYDSLRDKLLSLPDDTLVYPAHGAGSMCGKNISTDTVSTIGAQRQFNYALQPMSRSSFVELVTADQPEAPAYFSYDAALNTKEHPTLDVMVHDVLEPLEPSRVTELKKDGAQLLDVRDPAAFAGAHLAGSVNIGLGGRFATWSGTLLDRWRPIVIVADPGREREAAIRLGRIGFDHIAGYLEGGMTAADDHPDLVRTVDRLTPADLAEDLSNGHSRAVVDVRTPAEYRSMRIEGSVNVPLNQLEERLAEIPRGPVVVHCQSGYRSSTAASLLEHHGYREVFDLVGGIAGWEAAGLPLSAG